MRRDKQLYQNFTKIDSRSDYLLKGKVIKIAKFEELEYVYNTEGRCMSYRSKGKMTSVLVRNIKYGTEQRIFVCNPRVVLEYLSNSVMYEESGIRTHGRFLNVIGLANRRLKPLSHLHFKTSLHFNKNMLSTKQLIGAALHVGRAKREWIANSEKYLAGYRHTVAIFNLSITAFYLNRASRFVEISVSCYARGFFYGLNTNDRKSVKAFLKFGQIVSFHRWSGGFLTNMRRFKKSIKNFSKIPAFVVSINLETRNYSVLREKFRLKIPLICPIDSNSDPAYAEYPIPGNAAGRATVNYFNYRFSRSVFSGIIMRIKRVFVEKRNRKRYPAGRFDKQRPNTHYNKKRIMLYDGRKRNRTAAVSFSGLYSTIELSPKF